MKCGDKEWQHCQVEKRGCFGCHYNELKADEMFENLNYKKYDNHPEDDKSAEPNMWTTQDCRIIEYTSKGIIDGKECMERISFDILSERVICEAFVNSKRLGVVPFNAAEIRAINKKCEELGWI